MAGKPFSLKKALGKSELTLADLDEARRSADPEIKRHALRRYVQMTKSKRSQQNSWSTDED